MISRIVAASCLVVALAGQGAMAAEGGYSNYVPGTYGDFGMALAPAEKWTLRNEVYFYDASRSVLSGDLLIGVELFGAQYVTGIFVPVVDLDLGASLSGGGPPVAISDGTSGLGDVALIPVALYWSGEKIHKSSSQSIVVPTGDYGVDNPINTGLNFWSFDTNFALTYLNPDTGRDFSFTVGHIYNTENDDTDYQTGRELHLDVAFNQFFSETFAAGLHGFYLKQITGDSGSGALLGDFEAEAAAGRSGVALDHENRRSERVVHRQVAARAPRGEQAGRRSPIPQLRHGLVTTAEGSIPAA